MQQADLQLIPQRGQHQGQLRLTVLQQLGMLLPVHQVQIADRLHITGLQPVREAHHILLHQELGQAPATIEEAVQVDQGAVTQVDDHPARAAPAIQATDHPALLVPAIQAAGHLPVPQGPTIQEVADPQVLDQVILLEGLLALQDLRGPAIQAAQAAVQAAVAHHPLLHLGEDNS